jgi:phage baseplate assembly protein W
MILFSRFTSLGDYIEGGAEAWEVMKDTIPHLRGSLSFIIETAKGKRKNMSSL